MKKCTKCGVEKELSEFCKDKRRKDGRYVYCKDCVSRITDKGLIKEHKKYRDNTHRLTPVERNRKHLFKKLYNLTIDGYNQLFTEQQGKCKICGKHQDELDQWLAVDHDHITGKIRGLLCDNCNLGLGLFKDNLEYLRSAYEYLTQVPR